MTWLELSVDVDPEAVESVSELLAQYGYNGGVVVDQPIIPGADGPEYSFDTSRPVTVRTYLPLDERAEETRAADRAGALALWADAHRRPAARAPAGGRRLGQRLEAALHDPAHRRAHGDCAVVAGVRATARRYCAAARPRHGLRHRPAPDHPALPVGLLEQLCHGQACRRSTWAAARAFWRSRRHAWARPVLALDTDPIAVTATRENVERNDVADLVSVAEGSLGGGAALDHWLYPTRRTTDDDHDDDSDESVVGRRSSVRRLM